MSVLTPPVVRQLEEMRSQYPESVWLQLPSGAVKVTVPNVPLPKGWSAERSTVYMLLPVGYPVARPDCFWADSGLRLEGNRTPQNTGLSAIPETVEQLLWFSWHVESWNPNSHSVLTWLRVIKKRFEQLQ
jgi:hypothetical protein